MGRLELQRGWSLGRGRSCDLNRAGRATIVNTLGLDPTALDAVRAEGTTTLLEVEAQSSTAFYVSARLLWAAPKGLYPGRWPR